MINTLLLYPSLSPHGQTDGRTEERHYPMWAGHPDRVPPGIIPCVLGNQKKLVPPGLCGLATRTGFLQVYPMWAGHPDRVPPG